MTIILRATAFFLALCALLSAPAQAEDLMMPLVGSVTAVSGPATLQHAGQEGKAVIVPGATVHRNDVIETGEGARLAVTFTDGTDLTMGANGSLTIDDYVYNPSSPAGNTARFGVLKAAFHYVSGKIAKQKEGAGASIALDFGSIGVRGTEVLRAMRDGECWVYLKEGEITVSNEGGMVTLAPNQMTRMGDKAVAPITPAPFSESDAAWVMQEIAWPEAK